MFTAVLPSGCKVKLLTWSFAVTWMIYCLRQSAVRVLQCIMGLIVSEPIRHC